MGKYAIKVNVSPKEAMTMIKDRLNADLVHEEEHQFGGRYLGILIYEKYYLRAGNKVALTVVSEDLGGVTCVRAIATAGSRDFIFNIDLGASDDFAYTVVEIIAPYTISESVST